MTCITLACGLLFAIWARSYFGCNFYQFGGNGLKVVEPQRSSRIWWIFSPRGMVNVGCLTTTGNGIFFIVGPAYRRAPPQEVGAPTGGWNGTVMGLKYHHSTKSD